MRRIAALNAVVVGTLLAGLFGRVALNLSAQQEEAPPPTRLTESASRVTNQYQGVASCASAACHHGNGPKGTKGSEYTTWIAQGDPHSRAYTVLFEPRSLLIAQNLRTADEAQPIKPHQNELCLRCHVNPDVITADHHERFSRADGVGCESCHGAAEKWLSVHYLPSWRSLSAAEKQRQGMTDTKDVLVRARVCVRCHVGEQEADVNHDLIAAGHPRLRFEYGAYLANYPARHWKLSDDHARYRDFEARAWLIGQNVSAKAALDLLAYRAERTHAKPWPEFAEYGCFGCHHDLQDQQWRQKPNAGRLPWGTWYFAESTLIADVLGFAQQGEREPLDVLGSAMSRNNPNQTVIVREAAKGADILDRWTMALERRTWDEKSLLHLFAVQARDRSSDVETDWDRAAQRYLGLAAAFNALSDVDESYRQDDALKAILHRLADQLSAAMPKEPHVRYDSPRDYKPDTLRLNLKQLREQLHRHGVD